MWNNYFDLRWKKWQISQGIKQDEIILMQWRAYVAKLGEVFYCLIFDNYDTNSKSFQICVTTNRCFNTSLVYSYILSGSRGTAKGPYIYNSVYFIRDS